MRLVKRLPVRGFGGLGNSPSRFASVECRSVVSNLSRLLGGGKVEHSEVGFGVIQVWIFFF